MATFNFTTLTLSLLKEWEWEWEWGPSHLSKCSLGSSRKKAILEILLRSAKNGKDITAQRFTPNAKDTRALLEALRPAGLVAKEISARVFYFREKSRKRKRGGALDVMGWHADTNGKEPGIWRKGIRLSVFFPERGKSGTKEVTFKNVRRGEVLKQSSLSHCSTGKVRGANPEDTHLKHRAVAPPGVGVRLDLLPESPSMWKEGDVAILRHVVAMLEKEEVEEEGRIEEEVVYVSNEAFQGFQNDLKDRKRRKRRKLADDDNDDDTTEIAAAGAVAGRTWNGCLALIDSFTNLDPLCLNNFLILFHRHFKGRAQMPPLDSSGGCDPHAMGRTARDRDF